jgi:hypothetical protein
MKGIEEETAAELVRAVHPVEVLVAVAVTTKDILIV